MKMRVGTIFLLSFFALAMPGCAIRTASGPCYGFGCPSGAGSTPQNAMNAGSGPAAAGSSNASAKAQDEKPHGFVEFIKSLLPSRHTGAAPATAAPGPTTASGK